MATLTGNKVKDSYQSLLKLSSGGSTSTIKAVEDGLGVSTGLKLSTTAVEVNTLKITQTPTTSSSELTVLVYDGTTKEVKARELNSSAFGGVTTVFANPMMVIRPEASYALTNTAATPTPAGLSNTNVNGSHLLNDSSNIHLESSSETSGAVIVNDTGLVKIDINFILEVTTTNTDISINLMSKVGGATATTIQSITRSRVSTGNTAIGFSLVRLVEAGTDIYYTINKNSGGGASLLTTSTIILTKLD